MHEILFDSICKQLIDDERTEAGGIMMEEIQNQAQNQGQNQGQAPSGASERADRYEEMQQQMKRFQSDLLETQEEVTEKIRNLSTVSYGSEILDEQIKSLTDHLNQERVSNTKLSSDLAKSLELSLQLQLEIQGLKARMVHVQNEEKKYSAALVEKMRSMQRDIELGQALKDELSSELAKAKSAFQKEIDLWDEERTNHESRYQQLMQDKQDLENRINELENMIAEKEQIIASQHAEIEKISTSFNEVETSALKQNEVLKNLMQVAENKIVEMKVALDKKAIEAQDYYSHLQQALTQTSLLRQENAALKDYVAKLGYYQSQIQAMSQTALNGNV